MINIFLFLHIFLHKFFCLFGLFAQLDQHLFFVIPNVYFVYVCIFYFNYIYIDRVSPPPQKKRIRVWSSTLAIMDNMSSHVIYHWLAVETVFQMRVKPSMCHALLYSHRCFSKAPLMSLLDNLRWWRLLSRRFQFGSDTPGLILVVLPSHID